VCYKTVCSKCGDGEIANSESCDDGNSDPGDGCSNICQVEDGYECTGTPSKCYICGNGVREDGEECDDGNTENFDGCS
jgi:cysteine-rich repeat protein